MAEFFASKDWQTFLDVLPSIQLLFFSENIVESNAAVGTKKIVVV